MDESQASNDEHKPMLNYSDITKDSYNESGSTTALLKRAGLMESGNKNVVYPQYPSRFVALIGFGLGSAMNGIVWISLVAITEEVKQAYDVSDFFLNMCSYVFMIFYVPCNFMANFTHESIGPRYGILVGVMFTCIGSWFKIFCNVNFKIFVMLGNCLAAVAQPFFLNAPALITNTWFGETSRTTATSIASMSNSMGTAVGMIFPTLFVTQTKSGDEKIIQDNRDGIKLQLIIQACTATVFMLFCLFFVKNKPPKPPSASASADREPFMKSIKALLRNTQYLKLLLSYAIMNAIFGNVATLIGELTEKYGFNANQRGLFGMSYLLFGVVGANIVGIILAKTKKYKLLSSLVPLITIGSLAVFYLTLQTEKFAFTLLASGLVGATILPAIPVDYEFAAEITFPVGEASSNGTMMLIGQFMSFVLGVICSFVLDGFDKKGESKTGGFYCIAILAGLSLIAFISAILVKPIFKRDRRESGLPTPNTVRKIVDFSHRKTDKSEQLEYEPSDR